MKLLRNVALSIFLLGSTAFAQQLVSVSCDANSTVMITYTDARGEHTDPWPDLNGDGKVEFTVPDEVSVVTVRKYSDGRWLTYKVILSN